MECPASMRAKNYFIESKKFERSRDKVGEGSFGVVYKGTYRGKPCALKYIRPYLFQSASAKRFSMDQFERECEMAKRLSSPYIVQFIGVSFHRHVPVLITELMECSLTDVLDCHHCPVPYHREIDIALGIARGLQFLHSQRPPVVHRDLSSNNILLSVDWKVKIADLGVAKCLGNDMCTPMPGTPNYMPPEVRARCPLSVAIDLYSYAVLLIQLETRNDPQPAKKEVVQEGDDMAGGEMEEEGGEVESNAQEKEEEGTVAEATAMSEEEDGGGHRVIVRGEMERRENHIELMDREGILFKIVKCYLVDGPRVRMRTSLTQVIQWLEQEKRDPRYTDDISQNPHETPLEHRSSNHATPRVRPLQSISLSLDSYSIPVQPGAAGSEREKNKKKKHGGGRGGDSGYASEQSSSSNGRPSARPNGWEVVEGDVPSDESGRGLRGRAMYALTRLSTSLGLSSVEEDDTEYKQWVLGSL